jgi:hypothetical protein
MLVGTQFKGATERDDLLNTCMEMTVLSSPRWFWFFWSSLFGFIRGIDKDLDIFAM